MLRAVFVVVSAMFVMMGLSTEADARIRFRSQEELSSVSSAFKLSIDSSSVLDMGSSAPTRLQTSYIPMATDLTLMLALGAVFLLFGALLRHGRGSHANQLSIASGAEENRSANRHYLLLPPKAIEQNLSSTCVPTLMAAQEAFPSVAKSNEAR
jgi:hypothetical protein